MLLTWQALRKKEYLPLMMAVQTLFSLGIVLGYPLLFPMLDRTSIYLIATGAPAISMISVGLVALPQTVGEQKTEGSLALHALAAGAAAGLSRGRPDRLARRS